MKVKCVNCQAQMSALVTRMKTHYSENCPGAGSSNNVDVDTPSSSSNYKFNIEQ